MPLAFPSRSHGTIVFGFYNIETDSLLLEDLVFFCTDFCEVLAKVSPTEGGTGRLPGYRFVSRRAIGDLMGAIRGERFVGYLGEVYRKWPFPEDPAAFRQRLKGHQTRPEVERLLARWARKVTIPVNWAPAQDLAGIGPYEFSAPQFRALVEYVARGGYPTWEGYLETGARPRWVATLARSWGVDT
ncbi:MAG: hypothetical protein GXP50_05385 [Deltaproteobacteria bacterium]|nr:hypothetical protein [Deltaproteobacteria bacterium]